MKSTALPLTFTLLPLVALLTGCGISPRPIGQATAASGATVTGSIHGGQQPVVGATVNLMVPGTTGYGSAPTVVASTISLAGGNFTLPPYTCPANSSMVYLEATGGDSGSGINSALALTAALGPCSALTPQTFIGVSEVTTIATAYALAPFAAVSATSTGIGTSASNLQGLTNTFGPANNLASNVSGFARGPNDLAGLVLPQAEMNTLANILASCVNSTGSTLSTAPCGKLFAAATPPSGVAPADTFQAALDIALNPGAKVGALYNLSAASAPFQPTLATAPTDFALGIQYTGGGLAGSYGANGVAIDTLGNAWVTVGFPPPNGPLTAHTLVEISPAGVYLSGASGYGSNSLTGPQGVAVDTNNNVYVTDLYANAVFKFASNGTLTSTFKPSSLRVPYGIALDVDASLWITDTVASQLSHLTPAGVDVPGSPFGAHIDGFDIALNAKGNWSNDFSGGNGYLTNYGTFFPTNTTQLQVTGNPAGLALDSSGFLWYATDSTSANGTLARLNASGASNLTPITVASPFQPQQVAIDGLNRVWVDAYNYSTQSAPAVLLEYSATGALLSPAAGLSANGTIAPQPGNPEGLVIDGSGNVWITGQVVTSTGAEGPNGLVTELVGIAAPVVTPFMTAAKNGTLATRP